MSPEYNKVHIRPDKEEEFEAMLFMMGGTYGNKHFTPEELEETRARAWSEQRASAVSLLDKFRHPADPEAQSVINRGVVSLMGDVFVDFNNPGDYYRGPLTGDWRKMRVKEKVDWELVKQALVAFFERNLPEAVPSDVMISPDQQFLTRLPSKSRREGRILPKHIKAFIMFYGLDGVMRSHEQVVQEQDLKRSTLRSVIERTRSLLSWDKNLSAAFLESVPR